MRCSTKTWAQEGAGSPREVSRIYQHRNTGLGKVDVRRACLSLPRELSHCSPEKRQNPHYLGGGQTSWTDSHLSGDLARGNSFRPGSSAPETPRLGIRLGLSKASTQNCSSGAGDVAQPAECLSSWHAGSPRFLPQHS